MLRRLITDFVITIGLLWCTVASAGEAGTIVFVAGQAQVTNQPAILNLPVQEGDELTTGTDGYVYVKTVDNGFLVLRPNSAARIVTYQVDGHNPANTHVKLELLKGVVRSISGDAVKKARNNFRFNTPVAAIGVRGTDFIVYSDQEISRVVVVSGGIVMSGFVGACGPDGAGPCEGSTSRELFANQPGLLLEVQRGQHMPQLIRSAGISPDQIVPPRTDEPVGKVSSVVPALPVADVSLDAQKGGNPILAASQVPVTPPVVVPPAPPVVLPPPTVISPSEVIWGRWQAVAGAAPDPAFLAKLNSGVYGNPVFLGPYAIARLSDPTFVMPNAGQASFTLTASDVFVQKNGQTAISAAVENAYLNIIFGNNATFTTGLTVVSGNASYALSASGTVYTQGNFVSSSLSDTVVRGFLGGAQATEAAYLFQNTSTPNVTITGATRWGRQ